MSYRLEYDPLADKQAEHLDKNILKGIQKKAREHTNNPYDVRISKPVTMYPGRQAGSGLQPQLARGVRFLG